MSNSIYIHIPFCESKCKYCRFASFWGIQKLEIARYVDVLCKQITLWEKLRFPINTLYFWWGTPSTLDKKQIKKILDTLKQNYVFSQDIEISFESTPSKISKQNLIDWIELGINRISIGVQTLNKIALQEIDRSNKWDILEKLDILEDTLNNYKNISLSLDFIIGLPYVKKGEIVENLEYVMSNYSCVDHISVYMLEEYYTPGEDVLSQVNKFDSIAYPDSWDRLGLKDEEYLWEYSDVKNTLEKNGFDRYEISNYAKNNKQCRHNKAYWERWNMLAFWLSASGYLDNKRYTFSSDFNKYYAGEDIFEETLDSHDIFIEDIMFWLRTSGLSQDLYKQCNQEKIEYFIEQAVLIKTDNIIKLTHSGVVVLDYILWEII